MDTKIIPHQTHEVPCPQCNGYAATARVFCDRCNGAGHVTRPIIPQQYTTRVLITATASEYAPNWPIGLEGSYFSRLNILGLVNDKGIHVLLDAWLYEFALPPVESYLAA